MEAYVIEPYDYSEIKCEFCALKGNATFSESVNKQENDLEIIFVNDQVAKIICGEEEFELKLSEANLTVIFTC